MKANWLPNLVGGVSIWKLAPDLNQAKFFDGRLLVPETEGSESLPSSVTWDLAHLVPLEDARAKHGPDVEGALVDFGKCLELVSKEFKDPESGYHKYKDALTMPAIESADDNYFFDPETKKIKVINWGASPRQIAGAQKLVFGWEDWGALQRATAASAAATAAGTASASASASAAEAAPGADAKKEEEKKQEEKKDEKKKAAWWKWVLVALAVLALLALLLFFLRGCSACNPPLSVGDGSTEASAEAGADGSGLALPDGSILLGDGAVLLPDGAVIALPDAGISDAGKDGDAAKKKKDGGEAGADDDDGSGGGSGGGGGGSGGGGGGGSGGGGSGGGGGGGEKLLPHRVHFHPDAVHWRITQGQNLLASGQATQGNGNSFDVFLQQGKSFEGVKVQWQDKNGNWHAF